MDWFRSWHGAPTDPKWLLIAKRSETQPGIVSAVVWALFDFASQNDSDRGCIEGFDIETYAAFSGFDEDAIGRVIECLKQKSIITDGRLAAWEERQPKREDNSTGRVQKHRNTMKRNETQSNAQERDTDTELDNSEANASGAAAPPGDPAIPEREYFARGREVLGNGSGALIAKLLKAKGRNVALARAAIEQASQKQNPKEYIAACCRDGPTAKPLTEFQRKQQETNDVLSELRNARNGNRGSGALDRLLPDYHRERSEGLRSGAGQAVLELPGASNRGGH